MVGEMALLLSTEERTATVKAGDAGATLMRLKASDVAAGKDAMKLRPLAELASRRLTMTETIEFLRISLPDSPPQYLAELAKAFSEHPVSFQEGETLFVEGDQNNDGTFFVMPPPELLLCKRCQCLRYHISGIPSGHAGQWRHSASNAMSTARRCSLTHVRHVDDEFFAHRIASSETVLICT